MSVKLLKFVIALLLLPLVAGEIWTLIDLVYAAMPGGGWRESWALAFGAGVLAWLIVFFFISRTMWLYVLGHEFTHALAAMIAGGKVSAFQVSAKGGHVVTDRVNWWITLAPYFIPLYAIIWMALWLSIDFWYPLAAYQPILYFGLGLAWCFHLTFTFSMFHTGQTDLTSQGFIFSTVIVLFFNLIFFLVLFALLAHKAAAWHIFFHRTGEAYIYTWHQIVAGVKWVAGLAHK